MVIGYLMHERRWRLQEAFKWVCDRRPTVKLSPGELGAPRPCLPACLITPVARNCSLPAFACVHAGGGELAVGSCGRAGHAYTLPYQGLPAWYLPGSMRQAGKVTGVPQKLRNFTHLAM